MATGYTTVTAAHLQDATGTPISNATISFTPVGNDGKPLSFRSGGSLGQTVVTPITAIVTGGAFSVTLADSTLSTPVNIGYKVTVVDNASGDCLLGSGYGCFQPSGNSYDFDNYIPNSPSQAAFIPVAGPTGASGIASLPALAGTRVKSPLGNGNLYNSATTSIGYIVASTGAFVDLSGSGGGFHASDYIPANSGGVMATSGQLFGNAGGGSGLAFYDQNFAYISGSTAIVAPGGTISVPSTAAYVRVTTGDPGDHSDIANEMLVNGATLPGSYQAFGSYAPNVVDAKDTAVATSATAALVTASHASASLAASFVLASQPVDANLFDLNRVTPDFTVNTTTPTLQALSGFYASDFIPVIPGQQYTLAEGDPGDSNPFIGFAFYDPTKSIVIVPSGSNGYPILNAKTITAPAGAAWFRFGLPNSTLAGQMFTAGTTLPSTYIPFTKAPQPTYSQAQVNTLLTGCASNPFLGKSFGWFGDSIGSYLFNCQIQLGLQTALGCNFVFCDSRPGRTLAQIFEMYGAGSNATAPGTNVGSLSTSTGTFNNTSAKGAGASGMYGGTVGNTLAQDLADCDYILVFLGTNDQTTTLGAPGDSISTASVYGAALNAVTQLVVAAPASRLIFISPYWLDFFSPYQLAGVLSAIQNVCGGSTNAYAGGSVESPATGPAGATYGGGFSVPVIDQLNKLGFNGYNQSITKTDHTHPSTPTGFNRIVDFLSRQLLSLG